MPLRYLLDTHIVSDLVRRPQGPVASQIAKAGEATVCTSIVVAVRLRYGDLRHHLTWQGELIGPNDLLIAAHTLALGLTLVTAKAREFGRVPQLRTENWLLE